MFYNGSSGSDILTKSAAKAIRSFCDGADDPDALAEKLTPKDFKVGCKRMTPSDVYIKG